MTKTERHRTVLACVTGGCHTSGCFRWRCFPCVHAIAGCIGDVLGTCHLLIAQCGHIWFLHVSGSFWTTCRDPVVPHVSFLLAHESCCRWITCRFFIGPRVVLLLVHAFVSFFDHASRCCSSTCRIFIRPYGFTIFFHVSNF